jgi:hypothetical protein
LADINAASGSAADIQTAVNLAGDGDNVRIPAGHFDWNGEQVVVPAGVNIFGVGYAGCGSHPTFTDYTANTIIHNNATPVVANTMFYVNGGRWDRLMEKE